MSWLIDLLKGLWSVWLGNKTQTAKADGEAVQKVSDLQEDVKVMNAEADAAANSPNDQNSLIEALKDHNICLVAGLCTILVSCTTQIPSACPVPRMWSPLQEDEIAANLSTIPSDSPLIGVGIEWARLRAESKACSEVK